MSYTFIIHSAGERTFKIGEVTGKMVDCVIHPIRLELLSSKMQTSPDKLNNLCITAESVIKCCCVNKQISVS